jgi:4-hydroxy-3-methylbut-2-en-1-yl diphosphate reductase
MKLPRLWSISVQISNEKTSEMIVNIDTGSGFCFGVVRAIEAAEKELQSDEILFSLGDIVHNTMEVERLSGKGLKVISHDEFKLMKDCRVLIRAHGEPPETYEIAKNNNITLIDASCPIVLNLQRKIRFGCDEVKEKDGQIVIFGKEGHAEVVGLKGQVNCRVIIIGNQDDLDKIDYTKPVRFYAQTTQKPDEFAILRDEIRIRLQAAASDDTAIDFKEFDSICRRVSNRAPELALFAESHDVIIFASDHKSSNGKFLFGICKNANPASYFVEQIEEVDLDWVKSAKKVGICGATSTPRWVMEQIRDKILGL